MHRVYGHVGCLIHPFGLWMTAMPLDPVPLDVVHGCKLVQPFPEVTILHGLFSRRAPAVTLPVRQPLRDAQPKILRVCGEAYLRRLFSCARPSMAAISSMRLLVVWRSAPLTSFSASLCFSNAAQPPGPGFPRQAPSVKISTRSFNGFPIRELQDPSAARRPGSRGVGIRGWTQLARAETG